MEILLVVLAVGLGLVLVLLRRELRAGSGRPGAGPRLDLRGATWYYLLTGCARREDVVEQMETRPGTMEIAQMVAEGELTPTPLVRRLPHLPIEVAHLVHRLLAPVAEDRAPGTPHGRTPRTTWRRRSSSWTDA